MVQRELENRLVRCLLLCCDCQYYLALISTEQIQAMGISMKMTFLRPGGTYRIYDFGATLTIALDPTATGGVYSPQVGIHWKGKSPSSRYFKVPHIAFNAKRGRLGMFFYRLNQRIIYRLFSLRHG